MGKIITLTSDFGLEDGFVGMMKSVILTINPTARPIDLSHLLPPFDIRAAAFLLERSYPFLPQDSIHLVVVDPGVGTSRRAIIVNTTMGMFLGPDNGVLSPVLKHKNELISVREISHPLLSLAEISGTFHGRDVFAPAAGYLSCGIPPEDFGKEVGDFIIKDNILPIEEGGVFRGEIQYIDHFGNLISNIPAKMIKESSPSEIGCLNRKCKLVTSYNDGSSKELNAIVGGHGYLEIFCRENSAKEIFNISVGDLVEVKF